MNTYFKNLLKPWKLVTLAMGIALLIFGSYYEGLGDWDVGISLLMAITTFLTAPFVCQVIRRLEWRLFPLALFFAWFGIDGSYWIYNTLAGHPMIREANFYASAPLYFICGLLWMIDGNFVRKTQVQEYVS